jgi:hypothetical protein
LPWLRFAHRQGAALAEIDMKFSRFVVALAAIAVLAVTAGSSGARVKRHHYKPQCSDRPAHLSLYGIWANPGPQPNGCAQPVYQYGEYVGQDPDPNIRFQLSRDPASGYTSGQFSR